MCMEEYLREVNSLNKNSVLIVAITSGGSLGKSKVLQGIQL